MSRPHGQVKSLPFNLPNNLPFPGNSSVGPPPVDLAKSIYAKGLAWWNCDEPLPIPYDINNQVTNGGNYTLECNGNGVIQSQPTIRSGGANSTLFPLTCTAILFPTGGSIPEMVGAASYSIIAWVKPLAATSVDYRIITGDGDGGQGGAGAGNTQFQFCLLPDGRPTLLWENGINVIQDVTACTTHVVANTNYFLGCSKITAGKTISYYVNGALTNTNSYAAAGEATNGNGTQACAIGAQFHLFGAEGPKQFGGYMQDIALFIPALTDAEHAFIYNGGVGFSWAQIKTLAGH